MKRYRITTDGDQFRVQHRVKFGPLDFWRDDTFYEVTDNYPKVIKHSVKFSDFPEAEKYVFEQLKEVEPRQKKSKRWKVVQKYSDTKQNTDMSYQSQALNMLK